jgi:hypothetical protein
MRTFVFVAVSAIFLHGVLAPAQMKKPIHGLTSMGLTGFNSGGTGRPVINDQAELFAHPGVYKGSVINVIWRDLEPKPGVYDFASIDGGLKALARYNKAHPETPAVGKIRVWSGPNVPAWLMPMTGGPYPVEGKKGSVDIAGYWTPEYRQRWRGLQAALAAHYDSDPLVGEVGSSSCSAVTDESFILPKSEAAQKKMRAHGFNDAAERACLLGMADDFDAWKLTPVDQTFSPYIETDMKPNVRDDSITLKVMHVWRDHFGERSVLSNHSVQDPLTENLKPIFAQLKSMGQPMELQTASQGVIQHGKETNGQPGESRDPRLPPLMDWNKVIQNAMDIGANEIEIWNTTEGGGQTKITYAQLKAWAAKLQ